MQLQAASRPPATALAVLAAAAILLARAGSGPSANVVEAEIIPANDSSSSSLLPLLPLLPHKRRLAGAR
jgi:hypothetical protein